MHNFKFIWYQLTRPISYLFLKHSDAKYYNWIIPLFLSVVGSLVIVTSIGVSDLFIENGMIFKFGNAVNTLPGFFVAALAAIATFNRPEIDQEMDNPPKINIWVAGCLQKDYKLTRRDYLLRLFSYLSVLSLILVFSANILVVLEMPSFFIQISMYIKAIVSFVYLFFSCQLTVLILFSLYYLSERLNTNY